MSNYSVLKQDINNNIYENQTQQITGTVLNAILNEMTASLGAGYQFAGVATLGMNPGDPDQRVFYLAGEGIYTNFGGLQVPAGKLGVLKWDNRWTLQTIDGLGGGGANLTGYVSVASTDDLPDEGVATLGYLCGTNLYLYVGEGGDTKEGKYQNCGSFRGPEGAYIQDIEQTETSHENGGRNTIKMTLSDGRTFNAYVHNGTTSSGLFPTVEALQAAYPSPVVGQYAFVGAGFPADIYVCTTAGTWTDSGEDYDGDNVDLTDYATKAEVNQLEAKVTKIAIPITESGKYIKLSDGPGANVPSPTGNGTYLYSRYPVSMGDVVTVNGVGGSGPRLWGFVDANNKILSVADAGATGNNLQLVAPANSAEIIINSTIADYGVSYILKGNSIQGQLDWKTNGTEAISPQITENSGEYIGYDGTMRTTDDAAFTSKFFVEKGSEIVLNARGYLDRTAMIAKVVTEGSEYIPLVISTDSAVHDYTYIVLESGYYACSYYITTARSLRVFKNTPLVLAEWCRSLGSSIPTDSFVLLNPYAGANYNNPVCSQSHEHCFDKAKLESSYNRGIRVIACSHYAPATPRFPLSSFNVAYQDYKSKQALLDGDTELITRYTTGAIQTLNTDSGDVNTDTIPQIANAERPLVRGDAFGQHMNILGLLWGDPGHSLCNGEVRQNTAENVQIKSTYSLESFTKFNELLEDEGNWQFGSRYVFGTINHCSNVGKALVILNNCPDIFKAMELFNQGYSEGTNVEFRNAYDDILKSGKRIWGTAVVDWQDDWATWAYTTQDEKDEWQDKYDALTPEEQAEYGSAENYYMETGRYKFDRGTNVLLMDGTYDGLSASDKAKEAIMAYLGGRYYMSGRNTKSMKVVTDNHLVTFKLSDYADKAYVVTANGRTEYTNVDTINYVAQATDKFVRFEAFWDDGEFVFSNPVWVEPVS